MAESRSGISRPRAASESRTLWEPVEEAWAGKAVETDVEGVAEGIGSSDEEMTERRPRDRRVRVGPSSGAERGGRS